MLKWIQKNLMKVKPKIYIAMPCYGDMKVETCVSLMDTFSTLGKSGIECKFKSVKSSLVTHGRNLLTAGFLDSGFDYMLFVDADVEFQPDAVLRMLVPEKDVICTPYRNKEDPWVDRYSIKFKDGNNIKDVDSHFKYKILEDNESGLIFAHGTSVGGFYYVVININKKNNSFTRYYLSSVGSSKEMTGQCRRE